MNRKYFASDNSSPVHPAVMEALQETNNGHMISYGADSVSAEARTVFQTIFSDEIASYFVYNGTAANVIAIKSLIPSWKSVLAPHSAHINEDECGSLEAVTGCKIDHLPHTGGKIDPEDIYAKLVHRGSVHRTQPGLVSITQTTEHGQVYLPEEIREIGKVCRENELFLHMDGARISNAVAALLRNEYPGWATMGRRDIKTLGEELLRACTLDAGVHALSMGGTKNGLMFGEGIILMNGAEKNESIAFFRKQNAQLASKMRYISAQFNAMFGDGLWVESALKANEAASHLGRGIEAVAAKHRDALIGAGGPVLKLTEEPTANAVFVKMPRAWADMLQRKYHFYDWDAGSYRLMCSWDTTKEDVDGFLHTLEALITAGA